MKKAKILKDTPIMGAPMIKANTILKLEKFNSRFVYVEYLRCELRLPRKAVEII